MMEFEDYGSYDDFSKEKAYLIERKGEHYADIAIKCKRCNQFLLGYDLIYDDNKRILEHITLPACKCKRVLRFIKYTEGMLRMQAKDNIVRL